MPTFLVTVTHALGTTRRSEGANKQTSFILEAASGAEAGAIGADQVRREPAATAPFRIIKGTHVSPIPRDCVVRIDRGQAWAPTIEPLR